MIIEDHKYGFTRHFFLFIICPSAVLLSGNKMWLMVLPSRHGLLCADCKAEYIGNILPWNNL